MERKFAEVSMKKMIITGLIGLALVAAGYAQNVTKVGTTAAPFLNVGMGARAIAMGGAFVSMANDATALFWNPAGIATMQGSEAVFNHSEWIADINFDFAGVALNLGNIGSFGLFGNFMTIGEMDVTTELYPDGTGQRFNSGSYTMGVSYARALTDRFAIGANVKYVHEYIMNSGANGIALDIGTVFTTQFRGLRLGAAITNFGTKMRMTGRDLLVQHDTDPLREGNNDKINANMGTDAYEMPLYLRVGMSYNVLQDTKKHALWVAVDAVHPSDNVEMVNLGAEYAFDNMFFLRGGYASLFSEDAEQGLTLGAGLRYGFAGRVALKVDYAYEAFGRFDYIQKFTLGIGF
jgi:opacity protein-like surface antigen